MNSSGTTRIFGFGAFRLDATHRLLTRADGEAVPLTPKAFELLLILVESQGRLLTKAELMNRIWPDRFVEEGNLTQTVSVLRKALGEQPHEHHYIVTEPGQGYRFVAEVGESQEDEGKPKTDKLDSFVEIGNNGAGEIGLPDELTGTQLANSSPVVYSQKPVWFAALALAAVLALGLGFWITRPATPLKTVTEVKSIAVLPFKNIGGKVDEEYLGLGIAEVLITKLSGLKTIIVRPTSAVMKYGEASPDPKKIGDALDVEAVVMGRVQKIDESIRVTVQLVRVSDGATLWAETFDDKYTNIFAVQDSIATRVTDSLAITLSSGERQQLVKRDTANTEAFQLYLQGRYFWNKRSEEGLHKAVEFFSLATERDPNFARAYAGLADSYLLLGINEYLGMNPREAIVKAKDAANKAIALDGSLAEVHASLGFMSYVYDLDWSSAEQHFRRAIELNPNYGRYR